LLEEAGHHVRVAEDPAAAMDEMKRAPADLVIMDLRFPNAAGQPDSAEGLALIRGIRSFDETTPLLVLSGWPEDLYGSPEEGMVSAIMVKPVSTALLLEAIAGLVS
jgi:DNA-binding response OmpR family regulator